MVAPSDERASAEPGGSAPPRTTVAAGHGQAQTGFDARLLTVEEFARAVGVGRTAVYALIREGLPAPLIPHVGRRLDLHTARAWLIAHGLKNARKAKKHGKDL